MFKAIRQYPNEFIIKANNVTYTIKRVSPQWTLRFNNVKTGEHGYMGFYASKSLAVIDANLHINGD